MELPDNTIYRNPSELDTEQLLIEFNSLMLLLSMLEERAALLEQNNRLAQALLEVDSSTVEKLCETMPTIPSILELEARNLYSENRLKLATGRTELLQTVAGYQRICTHLADRRSRERGCKLLVDSKSDMRSVEASETKRVALQLEIERLRTSSLQSSPSTASLTSTSSDGSDVTEDIYEKLLSTSRISRQRSNDIFDLEPPYSVTAKSKRIFSRK